MRKQLMASVLLASMMFAIPVYADDDLTSDEYNSNSIYESPLNQSYGPIVNDVPKAKPADDGEQFAKAARQVVQRRVSGKDVSDRKKEDINLKDLSKEEIAALEKKLLLEKAKEKAEKELLNTDENFEPSPDKAYPGSEYQARMAERPSFEVQNSDYILRQSDSTESKLYKLFWFKRAAAKASSAVKSDKKDSKVQSNLVNNKKKPESSGVKKDNPENVKDKTDDKKASSAVKTDKKDDKNDKDKKDNAKQPLIIKGDDAQYSSESGDFIIEGNVYLEQGTTKMYSSKAVGNEKTGDIWLLEGGRLEEPTNKVYARWAHYNYNKETGELLHIKGASSSSEGSKKLDYYEAPHGLIENGMMIIDKGGITTRCAALQHPSCLSVKAKTITIIPKDRIIARNVQVFVKGKHIYSRDVWINDLQKKSNPITPHIGWDNDKGWYFAVDYRRPIGNPLLKNPTTLYMHQAYYTKSKYKPLYAIRHDEKDFYVRLQDGYIYDSDNDAIDEGIWLRKKMDWGLYLKPHRIAKGLPLSVDAHVTHGLWKYTHRDWSSWHTDGVINLRHDRFYPLGGKRLYMDLLMGRRYVSESLDNRTTQRYGKHLHSNIYHGVLGYRFSDKWNTWVTYHNEHKTSYLFSKGQPSFKKDWRIGLAWIPDKHNTLSLVNRHNSDNDSRYHGNYSTTLTWVHRFCCEVLTVQYQRKHYNKENKWTVKFEFLNW